ncbi:hypothetical protein ACFQH6_14375 [Halobacteriaceae archaeon GCM10025711]
MVGGRCKLCERRIDDRAYEVWCECGWHMDPRCTENHHAWCPSHGEDAWVGALEF